MKKISNSHSIHNLLKRFPTSCIKFNVFTFLILAIGVCLGIILFIPQTLLPTLSERVFPNNITTHPPSKFTVVIDPGHGGRDPGKVGTAGTLEKDINLKIALYLKEMLESQDIEVIMTRNEDKDLATTSTNFKSSDMKEC